MSQKKTITIPIQPTTSTLEKYFSHGFDLSLNTTLDKFAFQYFHFISHKALKQGTHIVAGPGAGKTRFLGRLLAWLHLVQGKSLVVFDPTGGVVDNLFDKIIRLPPKHQQAVWQRIVYIDVGAKHSVFSSPFYYRLSEDDTFFEIANRFPAVLKRIDPELTGAPILGWNSLHECLIHAGKLAAAGQRQLDFVADLIEQPIQYKGLLRELLAEYPELQPDVEYFRALMDPTSSALREKKTGSARNKLLPFLADPIRMATYAGKKNRLNWKKLINQHKVVLIDYRHQLDPDHLQFDLVWHLKGFMDAIKDRGMAGRGHEVMLIIDEVTAMLGQHTHNGHSILAEDLEELISRLGRNYGVNTVITHQGLYQVDERIQNVLMSMGNQLIGQLSNPDDCVRIARQLLRYEPLKVKKTENVWHSVTEPLLLQLMKGDYGPVPKVIDKRTIEFTPEEQILDIVNRLLSLGRFQFIAQTVTGEGGQRSAPKKIHITRLDEDQYPIEEILAPLRRALTKQYGIPLQKVLAEMQANRLELVPEKTVKTPKQRKNEPATMKYDHDPRPTQPTPSLSHSGDSSDKTTLSRTGESGSTTGDFWEPNSPTSAPPNRA